MGNVPAFPSVADAMAAVQDGLRFVAAADAAQMSAQAQAEALQMMERATAIMTAARASVLSAFTSGQGYSADADYSPRAWLITVACSAVPCAKATSGAVVSHAAIAKVTKIICFTSLSLPPPQLPASRLVSRWSRTSPPPSQCGCWRAGC